MPTKQKTSLVTEKGKHMQQLQRTISEKKPVRTKRENIYKNLKKREDNK